MIPASLPSVSACGFRIRRFQHPAEPGSRTCGNMGEELCLQFGRDGLRLGQRRAVVQRGGCMMMRTRPGSVMTPIAESLS